MFNIICIEIVYDIIKDLTEEYPYGVNRPLVIAKIKENGDAREYLVATIHAVADDTQSVAQIKASIKKLCKYDLPFVLMGDFNSQPDRFIPAASINTARPGKKIQLNDDFSRPVYIIYPNGFTQGANGNRSRLLDYVFVSDGINVSDLRNMRIVSKENKTVSDHNMVSATVGLA